MSLPIVVSGLPIERFEHLIGLSEEALAERGAARVIAGAEGRYPCRVTLQDAAPGESLLLVNYQHQAAATPYRSSYAIFVGEAARQTRRCEGELPPVLRGRPIALRGFDAAGMLQGAALALADDVAEQALALFDNPTIAYLHAHNAAHGCYAARIDRA